MSWILLNALQQSQASNNSALDQALADLDGILEAQGIDTEETFAVNVSQELQQLSNSIDTTQFQPKITKVSTLDMLEFSVDMSWIDYQYSVEQYASRNLSLIHI